MFPAEIGRPMSEVTAFRPMPGGAPANVAVAARRLGIASAFIGKVGDDAFGRRLIDTLQAEGVETRGIRVDDEARTTMAFIAMPDEQSAEFVFYRNPGADMRLRPDELDEPLLAETRAFHFGSISLSAEPSRSATLRAIEAARTVGALVSFDVNYRPDLWTNPATAAAIIRSALPLADLVKVNLAELTLLTADDEPVSGSETLSRLGPAIIVVTLGALGSWFRAEAEVGFVPAFSVGTVDATGCGDAFMAGVLTQLLAPGGGWQTRLNRDELRQILRYANAVGALTATRRGAMAALPTAAEAAAFLDRFAGR